MRRLYADPTSAVDRRLFRRLRGDENDAAVGEYYLRASSTRDLEFNRRALVRQLNFLHFCDIAAQICGNSITR